MIAHHSTSIGVAILTLNGAHHLPRCLPPLLHSPLKPQILVIDSSSDDDTVAIAEKMGASTLVIPRAEFNHGTTRELARRHLNSSIIVMVTQDAYAVDEYALGLLVEPLLYDRAAVSYGKQLPHAGASVYEAFHRHFNYPEQSHLRRLSDLSVYGKYTFFCSNSFAAYRNEALDAIGGFSPVLFGEDTIAVAKLLRCGHAIAYVAEAAVYHSHHYTLKQEFKRHFDIGYTRHQYRDLLAAPNSDSSRGHAYARALLHYLQYTSLKRLPYGCFLLASKWFGYRLGQLGRHFPNWLKRSLSSYKNYFIQ